MLKRRIIPKILVERRQVGRIEAIVNITTRRFTDPRVAGDPVAQAKLLEAQLADEIVVVQRDGYTHGIAQDFLSLLSRLAQETFMPLSVGGGITQLADAEALIAGGADKVVIGAGALTSPSLLEQIATTFGSQSLVVSIDVTQTQSGQFMVMSGPRRNAAVIELDEWVGRCVDRGAGEVLLCDVDRDGSGSGLNLELGEHVSKQVGVPVILSGGAGTAEHFGEAYVNAGVDAVAAGTFFSQRDQTPMQVRAHVHNLGVPVRIVT